MERLDITPFLAVAMARNEKAYAQVKRRYNARVAECEAAALRGGKANHPVIASVRAEYEIKARQCLGVIATLDSLEDMRPLLRAGWKQIYDAVRSDANTRRAERIIAAIDDLDGACDAAVAYFAISAILGKPAPTDEWVMSTIGMRASYMSHRMEGRFSFEEIPEADRARSLEVYNSRVSRGSEAISEEAEDDYGTSTYVLGDAYEFSIGEYIAGVEFNARDRAICYYLADGQPTLYQPFAILCLLIKALKLDRDYYLSNHAERIKAEAASQAQAAQEAARALAEKETQRKHAEQETARLKAEMEILERELAKKDKALQAHAGDAQELAALRDALYRAEMDEDEIPFGEPAERDITSRRIVSVGGGVRWLAGMKAACPSVTFIPPDVTLDLEIVRRADEVWLQAQVIGHPLADTVRDCCRTHGVPLYYYSSLAVARCVADLKRLR
ncbi:MAG: hypothetical protein Q4C04_04520 [Clostridia bacterium]|nr:hypothetical protein [Clostridia bacterium]